MEHFIVSARKYRPATFNTVVGQAHITNTLKNAIKTGHLAQAFLFCGPRGVGKTTCARILAKTINCTARTENTEACDKCESCESFNSGASLNVSELDAASNNSVDDIRNLVDQVRYAPQLGTHKVYIIDEVHMLSTSAFNAFLKTLEEPPKHSIFILATTEKPKITPNILSRFPNFDFNPIHIYNISKHPQHTAKSVNISAETDALHIIAQKADGALRDACSIFDQIVSFAGNTVTYKAVIENLNILDYDYYFKVTDAVIGENIPAALLLFNEILNNGFDGHNFVAGMGDHFRNLLVSKDADTLQLLEVGNNIKDKYKEPAAKCGLPFLVKALTILNKTDIQYKSSKNHRLQVELALMQLSSINSIGLDTEKKNDIIKSSKSKNSEKNTSPAFTPFVERIISSPQPVSATANTPVASITNTVPAVSAATTIVKKPLIKTTTPSINPLTTTEKKTDNNKDQNGATAINNLPSQSFTQQALADAWTRYANNMRATRANLASSLSSKQPVLKADTLIEFPITNKALEESINEDKMNLLGFLRKELNNYSIQLNLVMVEGEEKTNLYTANDRYKHLAEKNPAINKFRQAFDLDIEF